MLMQQPANVEEYCQQLEYTVGIPFVEGNEITVLQNGDEIFPAMLDAIEQAEHSVDFETFVYWEGDIAREFARALARQAKRGVTVRVLLDSFGSKKMSQELVDMMLEAKVEVRWFRPLATWRVWRVDKRTHRKILVIDDRTGFTGGVGIAEEWTGDARNPDEWRDTHIRIVGNATRGLKAAFLDNWNEAGNWMWEGKREYQDHRCGDVAVQIVRASATIGWTDMSTLLRSLVSVSTRKLTIVTAYFVPDPKLADLICDAAERGVDVRILVPGHYTDSRLSQLAGHLSIERFLTCGVKMWKYQKTMLHAKLIMVDDIISCVGSANLNHRSMGKDEECCAVISSSDVTQQLEEKFEQDCLESERLILDKWKSRNLWLRIKERLARLIVEQL